MLNLSMPQDPLFNDWLARTFNVTKDNPTGKVRVPEATDEDVDAAVGGDDGPITASTAPSVVRLADGRFALRMARGDLSKVMKASSDGRATLSRKAVIELAAAKRKTIPIDHKPAKPAGKPVDEALLANGLGAFLDVFVNYASGKEGDVLSKWIIAVHQDPKFAAVAPKLQRFHELMGEIYRDVVEIARGDNETGKRVAAVLRAMTRTSQRVLYSIKPVKDKMVKVRADRQCAGCSETRPAGSTMRSLSLEKMWTSDCDYPSYDNVYFCDRCGSDAVVGAYVGRLQEGTKERNLPPESSLMTDEETAQASQDAFDQNRDFFRIGPGSRPFRG
jgi:hypothetical protein